MDAVHQASAWNRSVDERTDVRAEPDAGQPGKGGDAGTVGRAGRARASPHREPEDSGADGGAVPDRVGLFDAADVAPRDVTFDALREDAQRVGRKERQLAGDFVAAPIGDEDGVAGLDVLFE